MVNIVHLPEYRQVEAPELRQVEVLLAHRLFLLAQRFVRTGGRKSQPGEVEKELSRAFEKACLTLKASLCQIDQLGIALSSGGHGPQRLRTWLKAEKKAGRELRFGGFLAALFPGIDEEDMVVYESWVDDALVNPAAQTEDIRQLVECTAQSAETKIPARHLVPQSSPRGLPVRHLVKAGLLDEEWACGMMSILGYTEDTKVSRDDYLELMCHESYRGVMADEFDRALARVSSSARDAAAAAGDLLPPVQSSPSRPNRTVQSRHDSGGALPAPSPYSGKSLSLPPIAGAPWLEGKVPQPMDGQRSRRPRRRTRGMSMERAESHMNANPGKDELLRTGSVKHFAQRFRGERAALRDVIQRRPPDELFDGKVLFSDHSVAVRQARLRMARKEDVSDKNSIKERLDFVKDLQKDLRNSWKGIPQEYRQGRVSILDEEKSAVRSSLKKHLSQGLSLKLNTRVSIANQRQDHTSPPASSQAQSRPHSRPQSKQPSNNVMFLTEVDLD